MMPDHVHMLTSIPPRRQARSSASSKVGAQSGLRGIAKAAAGISPASRSGREATTSALWDVTRS